MSRAEPGIIRDAPHVAEPAVRSFTEDSTESADIEPASQSRPIASLRRSLREPLLYFMLIGVALFVPYRAISPASTEREAPNQIKLTEGISARLHWPASRSYEFSYANYDVEVAPQ